MKYKQVGKVMALGVLGLMVALDITATEEPQVKAGAMRPFSKFQSVGLDEVVWTSGFWADKFTLINEVTIPQMWDFFNGRDSSELGGHWTNFLIAAGMQEGEWKGTSWDDGDLYKWLEAVALVYAQTKDPALDKRMDEVIAVIGKAQQADGYLSTEVIINKLDRFEHIHRHELYNMGHLMTAACQHYRATGKDSLLKLAVKTGDFLYEVFKQDKPEHWPFGFNPSNIMGAVDLYRITGDKKYLDLARIFIENRGKTKVGKTISYELARQHKSMIGTDLTQDRVPLHKETYAVGHAVTGAYLYAGATDYCMETGGGKWEGALNRIWEDVTMKKMYVIGGVGSYTNGLSIRRDAVHEAFGEDYYLPNRTAYNETCANIGLVMWNWRMLNFTGDAKFTDVMERVLYNAGISGLGSSGDSFLYSNVLRRFDQSIPLLNSDSLDRWKGRKGYCCPTQLVRTIAKIQGFAYSKSKDKLWVHLYGSNLLDTRLLDGTHLKLSQETQYPWQGNIRFRFDEVDMGADFTLRLRIPQWVKGATLLVNGKSRAANIVPGTYLDVRHAWKKGDEVELKIPMPVRMIEANPLIEQNVGQVAIMRGPLVYCIESKDLPNQVKVSQLSVSRNTQWSSRFAPELLGGVTVLEGDFLQRQPGMWGASDSSTQQLYREMGAIPPKPLKVKMIPYHAWLNRGASQMSVWLPVN